MSVKLNDCQERGDPVAAPREAYIRCPFCDGIGLGCRECDGKGGWWFVIRDQGAGLRLDITAGDADTPHNQPGPAST